MDEDELKREQFELEKRKLELAAEQALFDRKVRQEQLRLEQERSQFERRFWHRNFGAMISATVALTGLMLSGTQLLINRQQKQQELEQRAHETDSGIAQRQQERRLAEAAELRRFATEHRDRIFSTDAKTRDEVRKLILATFSADVVKTMFDNLGAIAPDVTRQDWQQGAVAATSLTIQQARPMIFVHYQGDRVTDRPAAQAVTDALRARGAVVAGIEHVAQSSAGDVRYFHADEKALADAIAEVASSSLKAADRGYGQLSSLFLGASFPNMSRNRLEVWLPKPPQ